MKISQKFKIAVKMADRPAYRIAQEAGVDSHWLSKVIRGAISVSDKEPRLLGLAKILGIESNEIFETEGDKI